MIWLQAGDRLPMVAVVQDLLRRQEGVRPVPEVDGVFGDITKNAVIAFQRLHSLSHDGVVGPDTWKELTKDNPRPIVDVVDTNHPTVRQLVQEVLEPLGSKPYNPPFLSNALQLIANHVKAQAQKQGKVYLLRLYGHGNAGHQNLATGLGGHWMDAPDAVCTQGTVKIKHGRRSCVYPSAGGAALTLDNLDLVEECFGPVRGCFAALGSLELHGCEIGRGPRGQMLLFRLALTLGVPVTATLKRNKVGSVRTTLRVEDPSTWYPWAGDLVSWAKGQYPPLPVGAGAARSTAA